VLAALDKPASLKQHVSDRLGHDRRYAVNTTKLSALDWQPQISLEHGLRETVNWYRDNEAWWRPLKSGEFWDFYRRNYKPLQAEAAGRL
jgi:dTDP-glucose 4,6-dehydratase